MKPSEKASIDDIRRARLKTFDKNNKQTYEGNINLPYKMYGSRQYEFLKINKNELKNAGIQYFKKIDLYIEVKKIQKLYPSEEYEDTFITCIKQLNRIFNNIIKEPNKDKFRTINLKLPRTNKYIATVIGAINILQLARFKKTDNDIYFLKDENINISLLQSFINILEEYNTKVNNLKIEEIIEDVKIQKVPSHIRKLKEQQLKNKEYYENDINLPTLDKKESQGREFGIEKCYSNGKNNAVLNVNTVGNVKNNYLNLNNILSPDDYNKKYNKSNEGNKLGFIEDKIGLISTEPQIIEESKIDDVQNISDSNLNENNNEILQSNEDEEWENQVDIQEQNSADQEEDLEQISQNVKIDHKDENYDIDIDNINLKPYQREKLFDNTDFAEETDSEINLHKSIINKLTSTQSIENFTEAERKIYDQYPDQFNACLYKIFQNDVI